MDMTTASPDRYLNDLAFLIAEHGITGFESDIARLVVRLRSGGHVGPLTDLLLDKSASPPARERALGKLIGVLQDDEESASKNFKPSPRYLAA
jgi:hypothetical protein